MHFLLETKEERQRQSHADRTKRWRDGLKNNPERAARVNAVARQNYASRSNDENVVEKRRAKWRRAQQKKRLQLQSNTRPTKIVSFPFELT